MTSLSFSGHDIEKWARFSGDRNPIHLELAAARRLGASDIVVHGMLVLLPVKKELTRFAATHGGWSRFKAMMKTPVLRDSAISLAVRQRLQSTGFSVQSDGVQHLIGDMRAIETPRWTSNAPMHRIEASEAGERLRQLHDDLGADYPYWVGLDALVFSHFISHQLGYVYRQIDLGDDAGHDDLHIDDLSDHLLVQISHQTMFCGNVQAEPPHDPATAICYQIDHLSLTDNDEHAFGTLDLGVTVADRHVMTIVLGLMVKKQFHSREGSLS